MKNILVYVVVASMFSSFLPPVTPGVATDEGLNRLKGISVITGNTVWLSHIVISR